ncbi:MAG: nucleoside:proton symporter [Gammaproteobacteria bacterium]|nr:nucleoside:proton symporter [Gammaproteobacteria bacterium]
MQGILGLAVFVAIAWALSTARGAVRWPRVALGLAFQFAIAAFLHFVPGTQRVFAKLNDAVLALQKATEAGTGFVFGYLGGAAPPFDVKAPAQGFILAFQALPLVLVLSALASLLIYWRILPAVVRVFALALERVFRVGGAVGFGAVATAFLGMVEAPLLIRPYLSKLTTAELFMLMTTGMATIAGTVLVIYATLIGPLVPGAVGHLLVASMINVVSALVFAPIIVPEDATPTAGHWVPPRGASSAVAAIADGTRAGLELALQIAAMLVVLVALVKLADLILGATLPDVAGAPLTLERAVGWGMAPLAWLTGIPWAEAPGAGRLLGIKVVLNEFIAYVDFATGGAAGFSERTRLILTYAMCGFANIGSLGILIGGMGQLVPEKREVIIRLGPRAVAAGMLATLTTGTMIGLLAAF